MFSSDRFQRFASALLSQGADLESASPLLPPRGHSVFLPLPAVRSYMKAAVCLCGHQRGVSGVPLCSLRFTFQEKFSSSSSSCTIEVSYRPQYMTVI